MPEIPKKKSVTPKPSARAGGVCISWFPFEENIDVDGDRRPISHERKKDKNGKYRPILIIKDAGNNEIWASKITKIEPRDMDENDHAVQDRKIADLETTDASTVRTKDIFLIPKKYLHKTIGKFSERDFQAIMDKQATKEILGLDKQNQTDNPEPIPQKPRKTVPDKIDPQALNAQPENKEVNIENEISQPDEDVPAVSTIDEEPTAKTQETYTERTCVNAPKANAYESIECEKY